MTWLLPLGVGGGLVTGMPNVPDGSGIVRLGEEILYLNRDRYLLWTATLAAPSKELLLDWSGSVGMTNSESLLRTLQDAELVIEQPSDLRVQAGRVAVRLTGSLLGNTSSSMLNFGVKGANGSAAIDAFAFEMLFESDGKTSIQTLSDRLKSATFAEATGSHLESIYRYLPDLVLKGIIRLDRAWA